MQAPDTLPRARFVALYAIATLAAWAIGPDGPVYWDSHGYVIQAITGRAGGLMLGRPAFVLVSHGVARGWIAGGGGLRVVEPLLRVWWMLVSAVGGAGARVARARGSGRRRGWRGRRGSSWRSRPWWLTPARRC